MNQKSIAIIGCGNLGISLARGLIKNQKTAPEQIIATRRNLKRLENLRSEGVYVTNDNIEATKKSDTIILALKPYNLPKVLKEIRSEIDPDKHVIISVATGVSLSEMECDLPQNTKLYRAMPNTASDVGASITCLCTNSKDMDKNMYVRELFDSIGRSVMIKEEHMQAATVLGACGIAYVLRFIRAMTQGGIQIGFDSKTAGDIVNQVVNGASQLLIERQGHPEHEIDKVTTPMGCTIEGLNEMEHNGFSSSLIKGIISSFNKIQ